MLNIPSACLLAILILMRSYVSGVNIGTKRTPRSNIVGPRYRPFDRIVYLRGDLFRLRLGETINGEPIVVTITLMASAVERLHFNCTACETKCEHLGAAFSLILEEKLALGLAAPPPERVPMESLGEEELVQQAIAERQERADKEKFRLKAHDPKRPWTDYTITSAASGKTYRLALRGEAQGESYCSCPDFRTNTLPNRAMLDNLAQTMARLLVAGQSDGGA